MKRTRVIDQEMLSSMNQYTLPQILWKQADFLGSDKTAFREKEHGTWHAYNWKDYLSFTKCAAIGLVSLGLRRGERLGLALDNHPEWLFSQLASQSVGAATLNLSTSDPTAEIIRRVNEVKASYLFVENQRQVDCILAYRNRLPHIRRLIYIDPTGLATYRDNPWLIGFNQLLELGEELDEEEPELFLKELWEGNPQDVAMVFREWNSPDFVTLSHENCVEISGRWLEGTAVEVGDNWFSLSSPSCFLEQIWAITMALCRGMVVNFPETPETASKDLREIGPTVLVAAPDYWEDLDAEIRAEAGKAGGLRSFLFRLCDKVGTSVMEMTARNIPIPLHLRLLRWFTFQAFTRPALNRLGLLNLQIAYSSSDGNGCDPDKTRFFEVNGLSIRPCRGLADSYSMLGSTDADPNGPGKTVLDASAGNMKT